MLTGRASSSPRSRSGRIAAAIATLPRSEAVAVAVFVVASIMTLMSSGRWSRRHLKRGPTLRTGGARWSARARS